MKAERAVVLAMFVLTNNDAARLDEVRVSVEMV